MHTSRSDELQKNPLRNRRVRVRNIRLFVGLMALSFGSLVHAEQLKVIELFTSQGCYSCPAADKLIHELASKNDSILNLEFHVDYWNKLQYRNSGNWEDPYSKADYTKRQRRYSALGLRGERGVYTPQAVINGVFGHVGSNRRALNRELKAEVSFPLNVHVGTDDRGLQITILGDKAHDARVFLVTYLEKTETNVTGGENHDKLMKNYNVVLDMRPIATLSETDQQPLSVSYAAAENKDCAVLVQLAGQGPIIGAARCP